MINCKRIRNVMLGGITCHAAQTSIGNSYFSILLNPFYLKLEK
jgi:hypothetical protein